MADAGPEGVEEFVLRAATTVFGYPVKPGDDFFALGGDSLSAVEIADVLQRELGVPVDPADVLDATSFGALAADLGAR